MIVRFKGLLWVPGLLALLGGCSRDEPPATPVAPPAAQQAVAAVAPDVEWRQHGLNAAETRFSPLADINDDNVGKLGLAWYFDYPTARGLEATPLVVDGVIYTTGSWSMVFANNATTGELLWFYDPQVPRSWAVHGCCDVVNRGVAYDKGRLYFGTYDGRLVSLNAGDGSLRWEVQTTDPERPYTITGAPRIVRDKVIIGNGGAEFGVRGYVSAYNLDSGEMMWRFYTIPGNPADGFENDTMKRAADTWGGGEWWVVGGGGTVWDSMAYDPQLNLLYIGVGNGAPWNRQIRSPDGGDNLFLSSIVALNPDDGSYVWHYQTTPGETWDYTATQHMILADLDIDGVTRKVIMQAPKNGFFYVLDRRTGELLSAEPYATQTWATHVDMATGRPVETEGARYVGAATGLHLPGPIGGHNWHPMSYSPDTGLVYIPAQDVPWVYQTEADFHHRKGYWNTGTDSRAGAMPDDPATRQVVLDAIKGAIIAWDPVAAAPRWRVDHAGPWNGGILSTAGNLVFQGNSSGQFVAYRADTGEQLWSFDAQTGVVAPPVSFRLDGTQYVAVVAGWGGALALIGGDALTAGPIPNRSRLLVFKLDGKAVLPPAVAKTLVIDPPELTASPEQVALGFKEFSTYCVFCHGDGAVSGGATPDLRALTPDKHAMWDSIVLGGLHWQYGMVGFGGELSKEQADAIHAYVIERAHFALDREAGGAAENTDSETSTEGGGN
ncbi:MAG: PQQ-dependent dehydrogenase, methanol/ethanol family [Halioglobus sp.]|nr:PQQ-dependent dehydrogenase, methanol/ethanol family [Halioglobus sp.]MCB1707890.1 PQQ-dependent dehydrogenase, methanol/ethanol family [Halioglobus sp.]MCP5122108.1 PQQ-dependent dehydrogenase, methanol/ethanol family [Pseudomonadales bacterium]MCP5192346.1 PQQ-dependent dehydrogenase, methanol/ethanol family [Pseudomonadales bacterium]